MSTSLPILQSGQSKYDNYINTGATIKGKFEFSGTALIQGIIYGDVEGFGKLSDAITISSTGKVFGSIRCVMASITGAVVGNIYAKQVNLEANSTVQGDIYYETLGIHANAVVNGRLIQQSAQEISNSAAHQPDGAPSNHLPAPYSYSNPQELVVSEYVNQTPVYTPIDTQAYSQNYAQAYQQAFTQPYTASEGSAYSGASDSDASAPQTASPPSPFSPKRMWRRK
jgi:cytoskeletal protein CcmA (bactofilin family)